jgi:hypothetical protein
MSRLIILPASLASVDPGELRYDLFVTIRTRAKGPTEISLRETPQDGVGEQLNPARWAGLL